MIRTVLAVSMLALLAVPALADGPTCKSTAADKKLAGAAMSSFMKKCGSDATATCTSTAADKKLAGAAKNSFMTKCVADATG